MSPNYIQSYVNTGNGAEPNRNFAIYIPANISIITGYYILTSPSTISLTDVSSSAIITILNSPQTDSISVDPINSNYFYILQQGSYTFHIIYTDSISGLIYSDYISFTAVLPIYLPKSNDIYQIIKRSEPEFVYTQVAEYMNSTGGNAYSNEYIDSYSTASVYGTLYQDLITIYQNLLPSGGSPNWELTLNNSVGLLSNTPTAGQVNPYYSLILQMLYSLLINNTGNKFDVSLFLSKYIYYRTDKGSTVAVYINEVTVVLPPVWILNFSTLNVNTILGGGKAPIYQVDIYIILLTGPALTQDLQNEIINLVPRLLPEGYNYSINFDSTLTDLGLTVDIGQTWKQDPRLGAFAIEYVSTYVNQAHGWVNPLAPQALVSIAMSPVTGTSFTPGNYTYTITGTYYLGGTQDITADSSVTSSNPEIMDITGVGTMTAITAGSTIMTFEYGIFSGTNTYTVT
jgi:hypothetical protein